MKRSIRTGIIVASLAALAAACGSYGPKGGSTPAGPSTTASGSDYGGGATVSADGTSADSAAPASSAPQRSSVSVSGGSHGEVARTSTPHPRPRQRPGLGTEWGRNLRSRVETRSFYRAQSRPFARVALHYNDAEGVRAHAAYRGGARPIPMYVYSPHRGISISLIDRYGRVLPGIKAGARTLVIGKHGEQYKIRITNTTGGRYELVTSVDGLDVIDGKKADLRKRGYILSPNGSVIVDGFRRSDSTVAAFRFGSVRNSYAARTSGARNVGVIGVAVFAERGSYWTSDEIRRRDTADPFPGDRGYARAPR